MNLDFGVPVVTLIPLFVINTSGMPGTYWIILISGTSFDLI